MAAYGYKPQRYGQTAQPRSPNNRAGALGIGSATTTPLGISTRTAKKPGFTQDQVNTSLAQNPNASKGGYMGGAGPMNVQQPVQAPQPVQQPGLSYDYSADPILNQITALSSQDRVNAQSNADMLRKQLAIDYGDAQLGQQYGGDATAQAAKDNPFSVRHQLAQNYDKGVSQLDEQYNQQNLFYGGARAKGLGDFANEYQGQLAGAGGQQRSALDEITRNLAAALHAADLQDIGAQGDAAGRGIGGGVPGVPEIPGVTTPGAGAGGGPAIGGIDPNSTGHSAADFANWSTANFASPNPSLGNMNAPKETAAQRALRLRSEAMQRLYG